MSVDRSFLTLSERSVMINPRGPKNFASPKKEKKEMPINDPPTLVNSFKFPMH